MTNFEISDFDEFFSELNGGFLPFTWQVEVLNHLVATGQWPEQIAAPTGSGKSSVVDIHIFANALYSIGHAPRLPRRLHTVVNRRGLVDNQYHKAKAIQSRLETASEESLLGAVSHALSALQAPDQDRSPIATAVLRGGLSSRALPVDDPTSCAVIASTPDMWGSRALFRGYGSSRLARPRETALMTLDSTIVLDEAHLNRQLLKTARRVRELQEQEQDFSVPKLQVVETTATPASTDSSTFIGVDPNSLTNQRDFELSRRLHAQKALDIRVEPQWNGRPAQAGIITAAVEAISNHLDQADRAGTIGCILNHVDSALEVAQRLRKEGWTVELLVGRMRPADLVDLQKRRPSLLSPDGDPEVDVVVATQTLEVGVDIDFYSLVTELAPGSALSQRFGRVNRLGKFVDSSVTVLVPPGDHTLVGSFPPYKGEDLNAAREWLSTFQIGADVNPAEIMENPAPIESQSRLLYQRLERTDVNLLARTSANPRFEPELELWLRDSLDEDSPSAGIVVRETLPDDDIAAAELLKQLPPQSEEVFPASLRVARQLMNQVAVSERERARLERNDPSIRRRGFIFRENEIEGIDLDTTLRPGDILVIDRGIPFTTAGVATENPEDPVAPNEIPFSNVEIVLNSSDLPRSGHQALRDSALLEVDEFTAIWGESFGISPGALLEVSSTLIPDPVLHEEAPAWILFRTPEDLLDDVDVMQEWSATPAVSLESHQSEVEQRARAMAKSLDLSDELTREIAIASRHHDSGKADPRFQAMLGRELGQEVLAKSKKRTPQQIRRARAGSGLPISWRHEQLSALILESLRRADKEDVSDLAIHIVGTSHGYGRDWFPHTGVQLIGQNHELTELGIELFTAGEWDTRSRRLSQTVGDYNIAFASFIERAADAQVSGEGK